MSNTDDIRYPTPDDEEEVSPSLGVAETPAAYNTLSVDDALRRYLLIQKTMKQLEDERQALRDHLVRHMNQHRRTLWQTKVDDTEVNVRCQPLTTITYNEPLLRERLGARYVEILDVDLKKLKDRIEDVKPLLAPLLPFVGTPSREKVRDAIESGRLETSAFEGAYAKTETQRFMVTSARK